MQALLTSRDIQAIIKCGYHKALEIMRQTYVIKSPYRTTEAALAAWINSNSQGKKPQQRRRGTVSQIAYKRG